MDAIHSHDDNSSSSILGSKRKRESNQQTMTNGSQKNDETSSSNVRRSKRNTTGRTLTNKTNEQKSKAKKRRENRSLKEKMEDEAPTNVYVPHEIVLATIPGFAPWPARILNIIEYTIFVEIFRRNRNPVRAGAISRFDITKAIPLLERKGYIKAIRELEMALQIPSNVSLFQ